MKVIYGKVIQIEDKRKIKKELGHSPDEADALALTYFFEDSMVSRNTRPRNGRDDAPVGGGWQAA